MLKSYAMSVNSDTVQYNTVHKIIKTVSQCICTNLVGDKSPSINLWNYMILLGISFTEVGNIPLASHGHAA